MKARAVSAFILLVLLQPTLASAQVPVQPATGEPLARGEMFERVPRVEISSSGSSRDDLEPENDEDRSTVFSLALGEGMTVRTVDGRFSLTIRTRAQVRATAFSDATNGTDGGANMQIRRARLLFSGNFFGSEWTYYLQLGFSNGDTEPDLRLPLRDAYLTWSGVRAANVRFGQGKIPFSRQRVISSSALQFADRSISNAEFNLDRDVGIQVMSSDALGDGGILAYNIGVFGGDGRNRVGKDFGLLYAVRVQVSPWGRFDDLVEGDLERLSRFRLAIQLTGAFNQQTIRPRSTTDLPYTLGAYDYVHANADVLIKFAGWSFHCEGIYRQAIGVVDRKDAMTGLTETSRSGVGYHMQSGYLVTPNLEVVARFGEVYPLGGVTGVTKLGELGGGVNWYFSAHNFKIQADYFWLSEARFSDGQHQARVQAQFYL